MSPVFDKCPICQYGAYIDGEYLVAQMLNILLVKCLRCGHYRITEETQGLIKNRFNQDEQLLISSQLNEITKSNHIFSVAEFIDFSQTTSPPSVDERAISLLKCFAEHYPQIGTGPSMSGIEQVLTKGTNIDKVDYQNSITKFVLHSQSSTFSPKRKELDYLIRDYHIAETKFITLDVSNNLEISPKGWARLDKLKIKIQKSNMGFIAMKFTDELEKYSKKWFEGGIKDAGYEAIAMYKHQHTNLIDNEMIALIKRSKFLVCDLTENSSGAYYEAGFAHGLDKPVMFLCEKKFFEDKVNGGVHFDTNHYLIKMWEYGDKNGEILKKDLQYWIEKTVGRGLLENK